MGWGRHEHGGTRAMVEIDPSWSNLDTTLCAVASDLDRLTLRYRCHWGLVRRSEAILMLPGDGPEGGVA